MFYAKHPVLGNEHFAEVDRAEMEAAGWVFWPHPTPENMPAYREKVTPEPAKRKPGRPRK